MQNAQSKPTAHREWIGFLPLLVPPDVEDSLLLFLDRLPDQPAARRELALCRRTAGPSGALVRRRDDRNRVGAANSRQEHVAQPREEIVIVGGTGDDVREFAEHIEPMRCVAECKPIEFAVLDGSLFHQQAIIGGRRRLPDRWIGQCKDRAADDERPARVNLERVGLLAGVEERDSPRLPADEP